MITEFTYMDIEVRLDDDKGVTCSNQSLKQELESQLYLKDVTRSGAMDIANTLKEAGAIEDFKVIQDQTIY